MLPHIEFHDIVRPAPYKTSWILFIRQLIVIHWLTDRMKDHFYPTQKYVDDSQLPTLIWENESDIYHPPHLYWPTSYICPSIVQYMERDKQFQVWSDIMVVVTFLLFCFVWIHLFLFFLFHHLHLWDPFSFFCFFFFDFSFCSVCCGSCSFEGWCWSWSHWNVVCCK